MTIRFSRQAPLLAVILIIATFAAVQARAEVRLYVASDGNDQWSGTAAAPVAGTNEGPFATLERARQAVRAARGKGEAEPITVYLRGGTWFLDKPFTLAPEDSGAETAPITWSAYHNERPVISGGRRISGWTRTAINGRAAWVAKLAASKQADGKPVGMIRALWVNGQRMIRARFPYHGTFQVASIAEKLKNAQYNQGITEFVFHDGDLKAWDDAASGEVIATNRWAESHLPIESIDEAQHLVHFTKRSVFLLDPGDPYWVENIRAALTEPGEFYVDVRAGSVYLIPPVGVLPNEAEIVAPGLSSVMRLEGDPAAHKYVEHVTFRGIQFAHTTWNLPDKQSGYSQAAIGVPGSVVGQGVRDCTFERCSFSHNETYGIELARGCQDNRISHCQMTDLGAGGVKVGEMSVRDNPDEQAFGNVVSDCTIADGGNLYPSCVAAWIGQSHDNVLAHNDIHGFWYTAISVGWTWGYGKAASQRNLIEYNHVHHIGTKYEGAPPILSDMGGIYTLGNEEGTTIRFNRFHDIAGRNYGGWGIYFDEGTTHIIAEDNLVYRTTHGGFHQHYGKENVFRNNIIAFGRDNQIQRTRLESHISFTFEDNVVLWDAGKLLTGNWGKTSCVFDHNTYFFRGSGEINFAGKSWDQWREMGMDEHSKIADPHFASPMEGDFTVTAKSDGAFAGFKPFDLAGVGPRK